MSDQSENRENDTGEEDWVRDYYDRKLERAEQVLPLLGFLGGLMIVLTCVWAIFRSLETLMR